MPLHVINQRILEVIPAEKWQKHPIVLGVSGGADSVAMLRLIHQLGQELSAGRIFVCHANHKLRGVESDNDQKFVEQLCEQLQLSFEAHELPLRENSSDGIESNLRTLRYELFKTIAAQRSARYVMTAHNANDQAETVLFRLLRGTGVAGLAGIPANRPLCDGVTLVRPMLEIHRNKILAYLASIEQEFRNDSSNAQLNFSRNKIRHQLIPLLENEFNCDILQRLKPLSLQAREQQQLIEAFAEQILDSTVQFAKQSASLSATELAHQPAVLIRQVFILVWKKMEWPLQAMTFDKWNQLADLVLGNTKNGQPSILILPGNIRIKAERGIVTLSNS